ncbi:hypothetical protein JCM11641_003782 [Rhodosporidiobolus odoratus]
MAAAHHGLPRLAPSIPYERPVTPNRHRSQWQQDEGEHFLRPFAFAATPSLAPAVQQPPAGSTMKPAAPGAALLSPRRDNPTSPFLSRSASSLLPSSTIAAPPTPPAQVTDSRAPSILRSASPLPPALSSSSATRPPSPTYLGATKPMLRNPFLSSSMPAQPRAARVDYEPPLPLEMQMLLLTTPAPPRRQQPTFEAYALARQAYLDEQEERKARLAEQAGKERNWKSGLVKKVWALRGNGITNRSGKRPEISGPQRVLHTAGGGSLAVGAARARWLPPRRAENGTGRIDSKSAAEVVPRSWQEYERLYANGDLDVEDPPFPPLSSPRDSTLFISTRQAPPSLAFTPYEAAHFPAPLHLSALSAVRDRLLFQLDLLGEYLAPAPPPTAQLPPLPHESDTPSPAPSGLSTSTASTAERRDSLLQATPNQLSDRRGSATSTIASTALSPSSTGAKFPSAAQGPIFPSRPPVPLLSSSVRAGTVSAGMSAYSLTAQAALTSLRNHPALVQLLQEAMTAPLGSRALFNPVPKAAYITLFPAYSSSPSASITILASLNLPPDVLSLPVSHAFDAHTLLNGEKGMAILDAERDWRWRGNVLVKEGSDSGRVGGGLGIRFYAGMPIFAPSLPAVAAHEESAGGRIAIGTVAVLDDQPRLTKWGVPERAALRSLASRITSAIERFIIERDNAQFLQRQATSPRPSAATSSHSRQDAKKVSFDHGAAPLPPPEVSHVDHAVAPVDQADVREETGGRAEEQQAKGKGGQEEQDEKPSDIEQKQQALEKAPGEEAEEDVVEEVARAEEAEEDEFTDAPTFTGSSPPALPPLLAATSPMAIYAAACASLASTLNLSLVYIVSLDLSSCQPAPSLIGDPKLQLISAHNLPTDSNASFDPALHLRALRAPEGGLLFRSPTSSSDGGAFSSGVLLPIAETQGKGWVLAGYTTQGRRRWGEKEMDEFEKVREGIAKVVLWQESVGWGRGAHQEKAQTEAWRLGGTGGARSARLQQLSLFLQ